MDFPLIVSPLEKKLPRPHGGTTLFHMQCLATAQEPLAKDFDVETIRAQLEALGERLNCDVTLEDVQDDSIGASFVGG